MNNLPKLDPPPTGKPVNDYKYRKIQQVKAGITKPSSYKNPYYKEVAERDQKDRGTCCGQAGAGYKDILYMTITKSLPGAEDKAKYKKDVTDSLGTLHDILYPESASAECIYQKSREIGGIHGGEGSETRFVARALKEYGANTEVQWHTAKTPYNVWTVSHQTADGGLSPIEAAAFAENHRVDGWAVLGDDYGNVTYDEVCQAIWEKGAVLAGIPVYENYSSMAGGDGRFPNPKGEIVGYHALTFYGYDDNNIYLLHSWGDWCGVYGSISKEYFENTIQESVYVVILDNSEVVIAHDVLQYVSLTVTAKDSKTKLPIAATLYVDDKKLGYSPQKFAVERGKTYELRGEMVGYKVASKHYRVTAKKKLSLSLTLYLTKKGSGK
jgi:hypothetical protein